MTMRRPIYLVKWEDPVTSGIGWRSDDEIHSHKPALVYSVGTITRRTKTQLTIVSSWNEAGGKDGDTTLPLGVIKEIILLCPAPKKTNKKKKA